MLKLKVFHRISSIREIWTTLERENADLTPFQYYYYNQCIFNHYVVGFPLLMKIPVFIVIQEHTANRETPLLIAPLIKSIKENKYMMYGEIQGSDIVDFIYKKALSESKIKECLSIIKNYCKEIQFTRINDNSLILNYLIKSNQITDITSCPQVNIPFGGDYSEYFSSLSKSTRQNMRTAYNRLERNLFNLSFHTKRKDESIDTKEKWNDLYNIISGH